MIVYHCRTCYNKGKACNLCNWTVSSYPTMFAETLNKEEVRRVFSH